MEKILNRFLILSFTFLGLIALFGVVFKNATHHIVSAIICAVVIRLIIKNK